MTEVSGFTFSIFFGDTIELFFLFDASVAGKENLHDHDPWITFVLEVKRKSGLWEAGTWLEIGHWCSDTAADAARIKLCKTGVYQSSGIDVKRETTNSVCGPIHILMIGSPWTPRLWRGTAKL
jgi:hypothetical protein